MSTTLGQSAGTTAAFTTAAPASTAAAALATDIFSMSLISTPTATLLRAGVSARTRVRKAVHSAGVMMPALSQRVTWEAPASTAAVMASVRKAGSARVASTAEKETASV